MTHQLLRFGQIQSVIILITRLLNKFEIWGMSKYKNIKNMTLEGSFPAVPKPVFPSKYILRLGSELLQDLCTFASLQKRRKKKQM